MIRRIRKKSKRVDLSFVSGPLERVIHERPELREGPVLITLSRSQWIWLAWAAVGVSIASAISLFALDGIPHVQDEVAYQLQARLLTELRLWELERLPRAAYPFEFVINEAGRRYGIFPNGWPDGPMADGPVASWAGRTEDDLR